MAAAIALAIGATVYLTQSKSLTPGPLDVAAGMAEANSTGVDAGNSATWGIVEVDNPSHAPIIIDKITIPSKTPEFVRQVTVIDREDVHGPTWAMIGSYPPPYLRRSRSPIGARVLPGHDIAVTVQLVPPRNGRFIAGPMTFDYHIGDHYYRATQHSWGVICAPRTRAAHCDTPLS